MPQVTANLADRGAEELAAREKPHPPDVAISPLLARQKGWARGVMGIGVLLAIGYFAEVTLTIALLV